MSSTVYYVDRILGSDLDGDGTEQHPYRSRFRADMVRRNGDLIAYLDLDLDPARRIAGGATCRVSSCRQPSSWSARIRLAFPQSVHPNGSGVRR